jgi:CheY-like chemotaxis protein
MLMDMKKRKILIVDDTKHVVVLLKHFCSKAGYATIEAYEGKEALKKVNDENPDLMLLDAMMPEMSGFEVCQTLRNNEKTKLLPIIMVTALSEIDDRIKALNIGVDDFISKPVDELLLITKIKSLLQAKNNREELESTRMQVTSLLINDLKEPAINILNNINEYLKELPDITSNQYSRKIMDDCKSIINKIDEFLDYSDIISGKIEINKTSNDLLSILNNCIDQFNDNTKTRSIRIDKNFPISLEEIDLDKDRILSAFKYIMNYMLSNSPQNGIFTVSVEEEEGSVLVQYEDFADFDESLAVLSLQSNYLLDHINENKDKKYVELLLSRIIIEAHNGYIYAEKHSDNKRKIKIIINSKSLDKEKP